MSSPGQIVILNGPSRSGKSSIATAIQERSTQAWMHIGMDNHQQMMHPRYQPGVGLRPQRPSARRDNQPGRVSLDVLEDLVPTLYAGMYGAVGAHARVGLNVVTDVYHHDFYSKPRDILATCAEQVRGLPVLFVGVLCPIDVIWERRRVTWGQHPDEVDEETFHAVQLAQRAASELTYDLELDTSKSTPEESADAIFARLREGPPGSAFWNA